MMTATSDTAADGKLAGNRRAWLGLAAWALFDWANSPFTTLIITFVFPAYFAAAVVGDAAEGQVLWGTAMAVSGTLIAVAGPFLGALADQSGRRKPWVAGFMAVCVAASALLWSVEASRDWIVPAMILVVLANLGFESSGILYNAMLPELASRDRVGRLSGWGWSLGYGGGLTALLLAMLVFVQADRPWLGLDKAAQEHIRVVGPLVALWFVVFALPLFLLTPDAAPQPRDERQGLGQTLRRLGVTLRGLMRLGPVARFLFAHMLYADGLATIFAFGGVYAAGVFGMNIGEVIAFGIMLNVTAGLGAFAFGWVDDWLGAAPTVRIALVGLIVTGVGVLLAPDVTWLWLTGSLLGIFVGPAQAASRSLLARLSPPEQHGEMFGLLALSGKATAFIGPSLVATVTAASGSQRLGLSVVLILFIAGWAVMTGVNEPASSDPPVA